jgi:hypothetical protein
MKGRAWLAHLLFIDNKPDPAFPGVVLFEPFPPYLPVMEMDSFLVLGSHTTSMLPDRDSGGRCFFMDSISVTLLL